MSAARVEVFRLMAVKQVAETLGVSRSMVRKLLRQGDLTAIRVGRRTLIHPGELAAYVDRQRGLVGVFPIAAAGGAGR